MQIKGVWEAIRRSALRLGPREIEPFATRSNVLSKHEDCLSFPDNLDELVGCKILRRTDNGTLGNGVGDLSAFLEEEGNRRAIQSKRSRRHTTLSFLLKPSFPLVGMKQIFTTNKDGDQEPGGPLVGHFEFEK